MYVVQALILLLVFGSLAQSVLAAPAGPTILSNRTDNSSPRAAAQITTAGGSFTTISINASTQTPRWKAYVGNVTGRLDLADSTNKSIFDWTLASVSGEVYASRNSSIDWSTIRCANSTTIIAEQDELNMTLGTSDSINRTFAYTIHRSFYVGTTQIQNSTCRSLHTYVNGTAQAPTENAVFQEMLLMDNVRRVVYTTLINQNTTGFNNQKYDFQMIVPENEYQSTPTTYYLYAELT